MAIISKKNNKVFIIAEAGVNHNGDLNLAFNLIDKAVDANVDAVKFQSFIPQKFVRKNTPKASYQRDQGSNQDQLEMLTALQLSKSDHLELIKYCAKKNIIFLSSPFDLTSADLLNMLHIPLFKIPSGEITNLPFLKKISSFNKEVILSTGMATIEEIRAAITLLNSSNNIPITLLHCHTEYPTRFSDANLLAIQTLRDAFQLPIGYSDHTLGIEASIAAVALGATVIEKHFTLNKQLPGPDHQASLEPQELKVLVTAIRHVTEAMGDGKKIPSAAEKKNAPMVRKSIVASCFINKGELFTEHNITVKRPALGLSPMLWETILGLPAERNFNKDDYITVSE